ncbi:hypothetical protein GBAR_LOCUS4380 [Geodia barretti]|uniref:Uncharacterized protein n=1 Tax=Geodia barretti TaxID=519541 RepID=A0AA35R6M4_GEOBA|nr:hypothetical protein GBAR_LOCUS4380 [Geodia barretti]
MASARILSVSEKWCLWRVQPVRYAHNPANVQRFERVPQSLVPRPPVEIVRGGVCAVADVLTILATETCCYSGSSSLPSLCLIIGRRQTGICQKMQNRITSAIRRSRQMGLLPNSTSSKPHTES